jgi:hypothetical protein
MGGRKLLVIGAAVVVLVAVGAAIGVTVANHGTASSAPSAPKASTVSDAVVEVLPSGTPYDRLIAYYQRYAPSVLTLLDSSQPNGGVESEDDNDGFQSLILYMTTGSVAEARQACEATRTALDVEKIASVETVVVYGLADSPDGTAPLAAFGPEGSGWGSDCEQPT